MKNTFKIECVAMQTAKGLYIRLDWGGIYEWLEFFGGYYIPAEYQKQLEENYVEKDKNNVIVGIDFKSYRHRKRAGG